MRRGEAWAGGGGGITPKTSRHSCQGLQSDRRAERNTSTQILWTFHYQGWGREGLLAENPARYYC